MCILFKKAVKNLHCKTKQNILHRHTNTQRNSAMSSMCLALLRFLKILSGIKCSQGLFSSLAPVVVHLHFEVLTFSQLLLHPFTLKCLHLLQNFSGDISFVTHSEKSSAILIPFRLHSCMYGILPQ